MKILHLSDTHGFHKQLTDLPEAGVIVHSGDFSFSGSDAEVIDFFQWFCDLPYRYKVVVAGNHDECLYDGDIDGLPDNVHYLCGSGVEIEGLQFWGLPLFMRDALMGKRYSRLIASIPSGVDVLVTHQPPYGILDNAAHIHFGDQELYDRVMQVRPRYHLFGHDHNSNGLETVRGIVFSNAAVVDEKYQLKFPPRLIEVKL